jgi:hypothetical protein
VFQHDCASFSSLGEQDHVGCSGRMRLKQIMHSGNGGVDSENVSMEVRSSPAGALSRLRRGFASVAGACVSVRLVPGFDRPACRECPGGRDVDEFASWACGVTTWPLAGWGRRLRLLKDVRADALADVGSADVVRSDWGCRSGASVCEVTGVDGDACGSSATDPFGLGRRRRSLVGRFALSKPVSSLPEESLWMMVLWFRLGLRGGFRLSVCSRF